jgi:hypothetical protein
MRHPILKDVGTFRFMDRVLRSTHPLTAKWLVSRAVRRSREFG